MRHRDPSLSLRVTRHVRRMVSLSPRLNEIFRFHAERIRDAVDVVEIRDELCRIVDAVGVERSRGERRRAFGVEAEVVTRGAGSHPVPRFYMPPTKRRSRRDN